MSRLQQSTTRRRGAIVPLTALMLMVIMAFLALSIDLGYMIFVHTQLQNAADAAALAGASQLLNKSFLQGSSNWQSATPTVLNNARTQAQTFSAANYGGGVSLGLDSNSGNSTSGDIVCGYLANPYDHSSTMVYDKYPYNAVQITVHRDDVRNGALSLFFARALGMTSKKMQAGATACYAANVTGFKIQTPGHNTIKLLPFTLDVVVWDNDPSRPWYDPNRGPGVLQGSGSDNFARNPTTGAVTAGSDGIPETKLYPLSNGGLGQITSGLPPGNFGTVDIGASNNSTADITRQILYGPNATDLAYFPNGTLGLQSSGSQYDSSVSYPNVVLQGDTGVSAGFKDDLASIAGQPRIIPLYLKVSGPGNNAKYTIVAFAGVTITEVVLTGSLSSKHLTIQPCYCIDPNAVPGTGGSNSSWYVTTPLALCR